MRVGIVGAGFAGSASALFLSRQGHEVTLFEAVEDPQPVGAGIMLQPTGMHVLSRLGLLAPVVERGDRVDQLRCVTKNGKALFKLPYAVRGDGVYGLGLHRGVLFHTLFEAVKDEVKDVRCGVSIARLDPADPTQLMTDDGEAHGPFDLIVVADGARSQIRAHDFTGVRDDPYPWGALWFVADDPEFQYSGELLQCVDGTKHMMGMLPTGRSHEPNSPNLVSLFVSVRLDQADDVRRAGKAALRDQVLRIAPMAEAALDQLPDMDALILASYRDVRFKRWNAGNLVFIGDAAHAMSPQLGQGSNLALYDAMVLSGVLAEAEQAAQSSGTDLNVEQALVTYTKGRRGHVGFYGRINRLVTPFFQSDSAVLGMLRSVGFPIASALPPIRSQMVATMCGAKMGFVRGSFPLPNPPPLLPSADKAGGGRRPH